MHTTLDECADSQPEENIRRDGVPLEDILWNRGIANENNRHEVQRVEESVEGRRLAAVSVFCFQKV